MRAILAALAITASLGAISPAGAQPYRYPPPRTRVGQLNNDVQRLWDDTFNPRRDGDRRVWERRREAERRSWCRYHRDFARCGGYR